MMPCCAALCPAGHSYLFQLPRERGRLAQPSALADIATFTLDAGAVVLLSEAERDYVTRAGTTTPFWWGSSITPKQANYDGNLTRGSFGWARSLATALSPIRGATTCTATSGSGPRTAGMRAIPAIPVMGARARQEIAPSESPAAGPGSALLKSSALPPASASQ